MTLIATSVTCLIVEMVERERESRNLAALLPKLMSGELRVQDAAIRILQSVRATSREE